MAFLATKLAQTVWTALGKVGPGDQFLATSGSATMIENTAFGSRDDPPEDGLYTDYTAVIVRDAAGAGASPEGRMSLVSEYDSSTYQFTIDTVTDAVAANDEIMLVNPDIPLREMFRAINNFLQEIGEVASVDSSLTTTSSSSRYTLPAGTRRRIPIGVEYEDATTLERFEYPGWRATADNYLILPDYGLSDGTQLYVTYWGPHTAVTAYDSAISEDIHPSVAIAGTTFWALRWLNATQAGGSNYWLQRQYEAAQDLAKALVKEPIKAPESHPKFFATYDTGGRYYPGDRTPR